MKEKLLQLGSGDREFELPERLEQQLWKEHWRELYELLGDDRCVAVKNVGLEGVDSSKEERIDS